MIMKSIFNQAKVGWLPLRSAETNKTTTNQMEVTRSGRGTDGDWSTSKGHWWLDEGGCGSERHEPLPGNNLRFSKVQVILQNLNSNRIPTPGKAWHLDFRNAILNWNSNHIPSSKYSLSDSNSVIFFLFSFFFFPEFD